MASTPRILTIGTATQDIFLSKIPDKLFSGSADKRNFNLELGSKNDVGEMTITSGGGATNAAVALSRQGLEVSFLGALGVDMAGEFVISELDRENVDVSRVEFNPRYKTDCSVIVIDSDGERSIISYRGAAEHLQLSNFYLEKEEFDWLYVSNLAGRFDLLDKIFSLAKENNIKIMWNPGGKELSNLAKFKSLLQDVDVLLVNRQEAQMVFSGQSMDELIRHATRQVEVVLITDGQLGVLATDGKEILHAGMYEDVKSVDRTGAGDAFGAGFLASYSKYCDLERAIIFASANSTSVIQFIGAKTGMLDRSVKIHEMPIRKERLE